jgi:hypothetical protein
MQPTVTLTGLKGPGTDPPDPVISCAVLKSLDLPLQHSMKRSGMLWFFLMAMIVTLSPSFSGSGCSIDQKEQNT